MKTYVEVTEYNLCNGVIRLQISESINVSSRFLASALAVSEINTLQVVDVDNLGIRHSQRRRSMGIWQEVQNCWRTFFIQ